MSLFKKDEWKLLWPFYLEASIGTAFYLLAPFLVLYFNSIGLNFTQIGILLAMTPLASLLFDVLTGAFADIYGRKLSVIIGWVSWGILFSIIPLSNNFYYLLIIMFLTGISYTFVSGAFDALGVDLLKKAGRKDLIKEFFAKKTSFYNTGFIISGLLGVFFVYRFGIPILWIVSGLSFLISAFFISFANENFKFKKKSKIKGAFLNIWNQTKASVKYSYNHPVLFYLFLTVFFSALAGTFSGFTVWTPLFKGAGLPDYGFGYVWTLGSILGIATPLFASKLLKKTSEKKLLIITFILFIIEIILVTLSHSLISLVCLLIFIYAVLDFQNPVWAVFLHRHVPNKLRATVGSVMSMIISLAGILGLPFAGYFVDHIGPRLTVLFAAGFTFICILLISQIKKVQKN